MCSTTPYHVCVRREARRARATIFLSSLYRTKTAFRNYYIHIYTRESHIYTRVSARRDPLERARGRCEGRERPVPAAPRPPRDATRETERVPRKPLSLPSRGLKSVYRLR